jgi:hypothetical protein
VGAVAIVVLLLPSVDPVNTYCLTLSKVKGQGISLVSTAVFNAREGDVISKRDVSIHSGMYERQVNFCCEGHSPDDFTGVNSTVAEDLDSKCAGYEFDASKTSCSASNVSVSKSFDGRAYAFCSAGKDYACVVGMKAIS